MSPCRDVLEVGYPSGQATLGDPKNLSGSDFKNLITNTFDLDFAIEIYFNEKFQFCMRHSGLVRPKVSKSSLRSSNSGGGGYSVVKNSRCRLIK